MRSRNSGMLGGTVFSFVEKKKTFHKMFAGSSHFIYVNTVVFCFRYVHFFP